MDNTEKHPLQSSDNLYLKVQETTAKINALQYELNGLRKGGQLYYKRLAIRDEIALQKRYRADFLKQIRDTEQLAFRFGA